MQLNLLQLTNFVDATDTAHAVSVWFCAGIKIDNSIYGPSIGMDWYGYDSAAAFLAGAQPIARHHITVPSSVYLAQFGSAANGTTNGEVVASLAVLLAQSTLDTPSGQVNESGQPVLVSFFAAATVTSVTVPAS